eukprot:3473586-Rhodomonas_salina.1
MRLRSGTIVPESHHHHAVTPFMPAMLWLAVALHSGTSLARTGVGYDRDLFILCEDAQDLKTHPKFSAKN